MDPRKAREALRKQGIYVHESDPILDMAAVCDAAMGDTLKAIEGVVKAAADRTSASAAQAADASKGAAEAIISQGAAFLVEQFREVGAGKQRPRCWPSCARKPQRPSGRAVRLSGLLGPLGAWLRLAWPDSADFCSPASRTDDRRRSSRRPGVDRLARGYASVSRRHLRPEAPHL